MEYSRAQHASRLCTPQVLIYPPRVLIVEDVYLVADMIGYMVRECGYEVSGIATDVCSTLRELARQDFHAVLLDCTLDAKYTAEIADMLLQMATPFAFIIGYNEVVEERHRGIPVLQKPFTSEEIQTLLEQLVGGPVFSSARL